VIAKGREGVQPPPEAESPVWTAPSLQGLSDDLAPRSGADMCLAC